MSDTIEFVTNYNDLSTDRGFQFESNCNRCGAGFRTPFKAMTNGGADRCAGYRRRNIWWYSGNCGKCLESGSFSGLAKGVRCGFYGCQP